MTDDERDEIGCRLVRWIVSRNGVRLAPQLLRDAQRVGWLGRIDGLDSWPSTLQDFYDETEAKAHENGE